MDFNFLDFHGLATFKQALCNLFATKDAVTQVEADTNEYITEVDYSHLEFDKNTIIDGQNEIIILSGEEAIF
jgi:hypothetical protein